MKTRRRLPDLGAAVLAIIAIGNLAYGFEPNYDESKVPEYELPDPLNVAGKVATNSETWEEKVRPATLALFKKEMYGSVPVPDQPLNPSVTLETEIDDACDGKAIRREYLLTFSHPESPRSRLGLGQGALRAPPRSGSGRCWRGPLQH